MLIWASPHFFSGSCDFRKRAVQINVKELDGFLGLTCYYRRFVKSYGMMAQPLTELTKINVFQRSKSIENAFQLLKQALPFWYYNL